MAAGAVVLDCRSWGFLGDLLGGPADCDLADKKSFSNAFLKQNFRKTETSQTFHFGEQLLGGCRVVQQFFFWTVSPSL
jgi:hypothetical protein